MSFASWTSVLIQTFRVVASGASDGVRFGWVRLQIEVSASLPVVRRQVLVLFHEVAEEAARTIEREVDHRLLEVVLRVDPVSFDVVQVALHKNSLNSFLWFLLIETKSWSSS